MGRLHLNLILWVFKFDGEKIHIIGADKMLEFMPASSDSYMPITSSNWLTLTVNRKLSFSLSYKVVDGNLF